MAVEYKNIKAYNQIWSPMGRYPMIDNTIFSTLEEAFTFATTNATAVVGSIIAVTSDENPDNNGVYYLDGVECEQPTKLQKVGSDISLEGYVNAMLDWGKI